MVKKAYSIETVANKFAVCLFLMVIAAVCMPRQSLAEPYYKGQKTVAEPEKLVTLNITQKTLIYILSEIKEQTGLAYGFKNSRVQNQNDFYSVNVRKVSVDSALTALFKGTKYTYEIVGGLILVSERSSVAARVGDNLMKVKGRVTDKSGNPIPGVSIIIHGTTQGVASDAEGQYELSANPDDVLQISFIGYDTEVIPIRGKAVVNAVLNFTSADLEEVSVVAFGTQKKESVVSAISTVRPMDLKSSSSDLTTNLAGRVAGIIGWQTGGMPGAMTEEEMNTKFYIRGITSFNSNASSDPLILIDGVESSKLDLSRMAAGRH